MYADDVCLLLLAQTASAKQYLLDVCYNAMNNNNIYLKSNIQNSSIGTQLNMVLIMIQYLTLLNLYGLFSNL